MTNPHTIHDFSNHSFWADAVADTIDSRNPTDPVVIKGGVSPSGVPHIGHLNEIMRGHYVAEILRDRGHTVRHVFTSDDRDRLRAVPRKLATLDGDIVELSDDRVDASVLGRNLGQPYTDIPDPFGCCNSYGAHFTELLRRSANLIGVEMEFVSNTELYETGEFDDAINTVLSDPEAARSILSDYQNGVDEDSIPFQAQCENCGNLTDTITNIDTVFETVDYTCTDVEAGNQTITGCGHEGTSTFRDGKLAWRFEWPAQWQALDVDFEPFGKDHAEGSWPSGEDIATNIFNITPPVPMVYEWFTLNGDALSSSAGNIITVHDVLQFLEVDVFRYFFTKNPKKQRDFTIDDLDQLVDEFDRTEDIYYDTIDAREHEQQHAEAVYPHIVHNVPEEHPLRIEYRFGAILGMVDNRELRETMAIRTDRLPNTVTEATATKALQRVDKARNWAEYTDNQYNYRLTERSPTLDLSPAMQAAVADLETFFDTDNPDGEALQSEVYNIAEQHDIDTGTLFSTIYQLFLNEEHGPRLGPFLAMLDEEYVLTRLNTAAAE